MYFSGKTRKMEQRHGRASISVNYSLKVKKVNVVRGK